MTILEQGPVLAIVRYRSGGNVWAALEVLADAGIDLLEVTVDTPGAFDAVRTAADAGRTIGVGAVTPRDQVRASRHAGAPGGEGPPQPRGGRLVHRVPCVPSRRDRDRSGRRRRADPWHAEPDRTRDGAPRRCHRREGLPGGAVRWAELHPRPPRPVPRRADAADGR